jgi:hydrogenase expression/formation protein HypC
MCLAVPGKIIEIYDTQGVKMGKIDFGGVVREACLEYVPEAQIGEYAVVHVGFALNIVSESEAQETLKLLKEIEDLNAELGPDPDDPGV